MFIVYINTNTAHIEVFFSGKKVKNGVKQAKLH